MKAENLGRFAVFRDQLSQDRIEGAIGARTVTYDLERQMEGATKVSCSGFGEAIVNHM